MNNLAIQKITIYILAVYTGLIATNCLQRVMASLARHGSMSWREYLYDSKIILLIAIYLAYKHFSKVLEVNKAHFYKSLLSQNLLLLAGIIIATRLVFSQTSSPYKIYIHPFVLLFFKW